MNDSVICSSSDDKLVTITAQEKQDIIDQNDEGDAFGIEEDLEALAKSKQQDSATIQIKVFSYEPFAMIVGITPEPTWKFTV